MPETNTYNGDYLDRAKDCWQSNQLLEAGRLLYENIPVEKRPAWAARILRLVLEKSRADSSHFERILSTADHPRQWANGHRCFDILRHTTLEFDDLQRKQGLTNEQNIFANLVSLAELVAKVTYNAVDPPDPFDEDSGWWIAVAVKAFVDAWNDEEFSDAAWSAMCHENS